MAGLTRDDPRSHGISCRSRVLTCTVGSAISRSDAVPAPAALSEGRSLRFMLAVPPAETPYWRTPAPPARPPNMGGTRGPRPLLGALAKAKMARPVDRLGK